MNLPSNQKDEMLSAFWQPKPHSNSISMSNIAPPIRKSFTEEELMKAARYKAGRLHADTESPYRSTGDYHRDIGLLLDFATDLWLGLDVGPQ